MGKLPHWLNAVLVPSTENGHTPNNKAIELFQMKPTRCTLRLSIFSSTSVNVSGN